MNSVQLFQSPSGSQWMPYPTFCYAAAPTFSAPDCTFHRRHQTSRASAFSEKVLRSKICLYGDCNFGLACYFTCKSCCTIDQHCVESLSECDDWFQTGHMQVQDRCCRRWRGALADTRMRVGYSLHVRSKDMSQPCCQLNSILQSHSSVAWDKLHGIINIRRNVWQNWR